MEFSFANFRLAHHDASNLFCFCIFFKFPAKRKLFLKCFTKHWASKQNQNLNKTGKEIFHVLRLCVTLYRRQIVFFFFFCRCLLLLKMTAKISVANFFLWHNRRLYYYLWTCGHDAARKIVDSKVKKNLIDVNVSGYVEKRNRFPFLEIIFSCKVWNVNARWQQLLEESSATFTKPTFQNLNEQVVKRRSCWLIVFDQSTNILQQVNCH